MSVLDLPLSAPSEDWMREYCQERGGIFHAILDRPPAPEDMPLYASLKSPKGMQIHEALYRGKAVIFSLPVSWLRGKGGSPQVSLEGYGDTEALIK